MSCATAPCPMCVQRAQCRADIKPPPGYYGPPPAAPAASSSGAAGAVAGSRPGAGISSAPPTLIARLGLQGRVAESDARTSPPAKITNAEAKQLEFKERKARMVLDARWRVAGVHHAR